MLISHVQQRAAPASQPQSAEEESPIEEAPAEGEQEHRLYAAAEEVAKAELCLSRLCAARTQGQPSMTSPASVQFVGRRSMPDNMMVESEAQSACPDGAAKIVTIESTRESVNPRNRTFHSAC